MHVPPRSIVRSPEFDSFLQEHIPSLETADEFMQGVEYLLAFHPEIGMQTESKWVWFISLPPVNYETLYVYYTFDEATVELLAVLPADRTQDRNWPQG